MTTKTYRSPSSIAINVVLANGSNLLISFSSKTIGGSVFTTSSEEIQQAIEKHYNYNRLFFLERTVTTEEKNTETKHSDNLTTKADDTEKETSEKTNKDDVDNLNDGICDETKETSEEKNEDDLESVNATESESETNGKTKVNISDLETAKQYLHETFGEPKSNLRSKKSVLEFAESKNIEFVGL